ncbi:hypothetical protein PtB15_6B785 [Puccinia triticina]|nr:hypothetical protein PtB15_6B785 [Puccinia triticina]
MAVLSRRILFCVVLCTIGITHLALCSLEATALDRVTEQLPSCSLEDVAPIEHINHAESSSGSYQFGRVPEQLQETHTGLSLWNSMAKLEDEIVELLQFEHEYYPGPLKISMLPAPEQVKTINSFFRTFSDLESLNKSPTPSEAEIMLKVLQFLLLMRLEIQRTQRGASAVTEKIEIAKPTVVVDLVALHTKLLVHKLGNNFFDSFESVVPDITFLESGAAMGYFRGAITALPEEDKQSAVHAVLTTILAHEREIFPETVHRSTQFIKICTGFRNSKLLLPEHIATLVNILENPEAALGNSTGRRIQYQLVFYLFDSIKRDTNIMIEALKHSCDRGVFQSKLGFMGMYLKKYRNRFLDGRYKHTEQELSPMGSLARTYEPFRNWIFIVLHETFGHKTHSELHEEIGKARHDLWMRDLSNDELVQLLHVLPSDRFWHYVHATKSGLTESEHGHWPTSDIIRLIID